MLFYPCLFKNYINNETIRVQFISDINNTFKKFKEIDANINCFIIILDFVFNYFTNRNNLNYENIKLLNEEILNGKDNEYDDYMIYNNNVINNNNFKSDIKINKHDCGNNKKNLNLLEVEKDYVEDEKSFNNFKISTNRTDINKLEDDTILNAIIDNINKHKNKSKNSKNNSKKKNKNKNKK